MKKILIIDSEPSYQERQIRFLKKFYDIKLAISLGAINNRINEYKFDLVFFEPSFPCENRYPFNKFNCDALTKPGWLLYEDKLKNLSCPIVLFSYEITDYFQKYKWGKNVSFLLKKSEDDYLLKKAEELIGM